MRLTITEVKHIADLSRLKLTDEEMEKYCLQLSVILDYVAQLQEVDTGKILIDEEKLPQLSVLREDTPEDSLSVDDVLKNAPDTKKRQIRVPPVFE
jgi:aspartyl-tRNA(Asn)/glutamyl-tRNA(Gln) amidotransferase subunit C